MNIISQIQLELARPKYESKQSQVSWYLKFFLNTKNSICTKKKLNTKNILTKGELRFTAISSEDQMNAKDPTNA